MRKVVKLIANVLLVIGVVVLLGFVAAEHASMKCTGLQIHLNNQEEYTFITAEEVAAVVNSKGPVDGKTFQEIDISLTEKLIRSMPEIHTANVFTDLNGILHVEATQRRPLVRVFTKAGDSYYIDEEGYFMPLSEHYTARVPVASGNIRMSYLAGTALGHVTAIRANDSLADLTMVDEIYEVAAYVAKDDFWRSNTEQISINEKEEIELIPRVGDHVIVLGDATDLEGKFRRLMAMYTTGFPARSWDEYRTISLKYENQVVCTRK